MNNKTMRANGKTFSFAAFFFDPITRNDIEILYEFFRTIDDLVDEGVQPIKEIETKLETVRSHIHAMESDLSYVKKVLPVIQKYMIPFIYIDTFLDTMKRDVVVHSYKTIRELQEYEYGVAGVVGICLAHVVSSKKESYEFAELLGDAMQYTNILRDVYDDASRGKYYIPEEIYSSFALTTNDFTRREKTEALEKMYKACITENKRMYEDARKGFSYIPSFRARFCIVLASLLYERILFHITQSDNQAIRAHVPLIEKIVFIPYAVYIALGGK